jgi:precorrin-6Y C5,15-methyltransferase (decarboxylating)
MDDPPPAAACPWLTVVGIGEDGADGLSAAARAAVNAAEAVAGAPRHLALLGPVAAETLALDSPFSAQLPRLLALRPRRTVALASGDPFWHGLGATLAARLGPGEMTAIPAPSTFSWMAARLGWPIEGCDTLALHARPLALIRPRLRPGARLLVLLRDGAAAGALAAELVACGFGPSRLVTMEALGGPRERVREARADAFAAADVGAPVAAAVEAAAAPDARIVPRVAGLPDALFAHDGQLTKREIRAMTLSALAPRGDELLWDVGVGAGSIAIEWLLAHPLNRAIGIERRADRLARARANAEALGAPHLDLRAGAAPAALAGLPAPDAVFFGGGADLAGIEAALRALRPGGRLVVNAVTVDTEALLAACHLRFGGQLIRITLSRAGPMGGRIGWRAAAPVTQWSIAT